MTEPRSALEWVGLALAVLVAIVVVLFVVFVAVAMGVAAWHFFVHQLQVGQ